MPVFKTIPLLLAIALLSCTPGGGPAPSPSASATGVSGVPPAGALATPGADAPIPGPDRLKPLTALGPCDSSPKAADAEQPQGLVLPEEAVMIQVTPADPLTNVQGYVAMTPVQVRAFYQRHPDVTVISVEDEGFEAEILFEADARRVFIKAQAVCDLGSLFVAVVSPVAQ